MCATTKLFLPAMLAGFVAASFTNQPLIGWTVAGIVGSLLYLRGRRRAESLSCAFPPSAVNHPLQTLGTESVSIRGNAERHPDWKI